MGCSIAKSNAPRKTLNYSAQKQTFMPRKEVQRYLFPKQKILLLENWQFLCKTDPLIFQKIWRTAIERSPNMRTIMGIPIGDILESDSIFSKLTSQATKFFEKIIVELNLDKLNVARACFDLGNRHWNYAGGSEFSEIYLDIFIYCIGREVENCNQDENPLEENSSLLEAWERFLAFVTFHIREGFLDAHSKAVRRGEVAPRLN